MSRQNEALRLDSCLQSQPEKGVLKIYALAACQETDTHTQTHTYILNHTQTHIQVERKFVAHNGSNLNYAARDLARR